MTSTGEWLPENATTLSLDCEQLKRLARISAENKLDTIKTVLTESEQTELAQSMAASREQWQAAANPLTNDELIDLIKTLAIAEMQIPNCNLGAKSVVIHIHRLVKQRGNALGKEDLRWLKQNSTNRYLPNGPVL